MTAVRNPGGWVFFVLVFLLCISRNLGLAEDEPATRLLMKSDKVRNMLYDNATFDLVVTTATQGAEDREFKFRVHTRGGTRSLVHFLAPARDRGKKLLMIDEYLWFYIPGVRKPIRIAPQQKMTGMVSYADVARTHFSADYTPRLMGLEEMEGRPVYALKLTAKRTTLSYRTITYYIDASDHFPVCAVFHALSGKPMKKSLFHRGRDDKEYRITITSLIGTGEHSLLEFSNFTETTLPDRLFNKNYLHYTD